MLLAFTKMHGLGNDFVVLDGVHQSFSLTPGQIRKIADRRFGIGCDQVLLVGASDKKDVDFHYRIFNADGGEVEQCGNGARCFARFVREKGLTDKSELAVETLCGIIYPIIEADGQVRVNMGVPQFDPAQVPFQAERRQPVYNLDIGGQIIPMSVLSVGNPHAVQIVEDVERAPVTSQGPLVENHPRFPQRVNAGYMQIIDRTHIQLRVYERGTGETLACGTGACAAVVAGRLRHLLDDTVEVAVRGGRLRISWEGEGQPVWMTGSATTVYDGSIDLDNL
jgi:diaminopimelate epimerase